MTQRNKLLYILSIVFLGIAFIGGAVAVTGFFLKSPITQLVGVIILGIAYLVSAVLDFISRRTGGDKENKRSLFRKK